MIFSKFSKCLKTNLKIRLVMYCILIVFMILFSIYKNFIGLFISYMVLGCLSISYIRLCAKKYFNITKYIASEIVEASSSPCYNKTKLAENINNFDTLNNRDWIINLKHLRFIIISFIIISIIFWISETTLLYISYTNASIPVSVGLMCFIDSIIFLLIKNIIVFRDRKKDLSDKIEEAKKALNEYMKDKSITEG